MTKPQITTKSSKQLALTYNELDQNFINLRDSTIGFRIPGVGSEPTRPAKTVTAFGDANISTAQSQFGTASLALDGDGDYAFVQSNVDFEFGSGDFTIEGWIRRVGSGTTQQIIDVRAAAQPTVSATLQINASNVLTYVAAGSTRITGTIVTANVWHHIAVSRQGNSTKLFFNGTQVGSTYTDTNVYVQGPVYIGSRPDGALNFNGFIDDLRISKGIARYTANFTPPTQPFVNDSNTVLLLHFDTDLSDDTGFVAVEDIVVDLDLNGRLGLIAGDNITLALDTQTKTLTINSQGGVQSVSGTAGRITSTGGQNPVLDLVTTGVTPGSYTASNLTVDSFGRITGISSGSSLNSFTNITNNINTAVADTINDTLTIIGNSPILVSINDNTDTVSISFTTSSISNRVSQLTTPVNSDNMLFVNGFNRFMINSQVWSTTAGAHAAYTSTGVINFQNSAIGTTAGYTSTQHIGLTTNITSFTLPAISNSSNTFFRGPNKFWVLFTNSTSGNFSITGWNDSPYNLTWVGTNRDTINFTASNQYILLEFTCIFILGIGYNSRYWIGETLMTNIP
jgi:hypothetical protein